MNYRSDHVKVLEFLAQDLPKRTSYKVAAIAKAFSDLSKRKPALNIPVDRVVRNALRKPRHEGHVEISERGDYCLTPDGAAFIRKLPSYEVAPEYKSNRTVSRMPRVNLTGKKVVKTKLKASSKKVDKKAAKVSKKSDKKLASKPGKKIKVAKPEKKSKVRRPLVEDEVVSPPIEVEAANDSVEAAPFVDNWMEPVTSSEPDEESGNEVNTSEDQSSGTDHLVI